LADSGDVTAFLPTNVMSITDGQWILDMDVFRNGLRPAINVGLSVTRVGSRGHNDRQKKQNADVFKALTGFARAQEFSRFGTELALQAQKDITLGNQLHALMTQIPGETYGLVSQQLMIDTVLDPVASIGIKIPELKNAIQEIASQVKKEEDYDVALVRLKERVLPKGAAK
jgi:F-type H+-transporting ATPase subunit alpha